MRNQWSQNNLWKSKSHSHQSAKAIFCVNFHLLLACFIPWYMVISFCTFHWASLVCWVSPCTIIPSLYLTQLKNESPWLVGNIYPSDFSSLGISWWTLIFCLFACLFVPLSNQFKNQVVSSRKKKPRRIWIGFAIYW